MDTKKRATIKDVAKLAETSVATVSRVLSNTDYPVSDTLRKKVEDVARSLCFVPNTSRQNTSVTRKMIGLVVPTVSNPFYMQTIQGISAVCYDQGYGLLLCDTQNSMQKEQRFLKDLFNSKVSGVIMSSINEENNLLSDYIARGMLVVQLDQKIENEGCYSINFDSRLGARMAVKHLQEKGHSKIAFATTPITRWTRKQIYKGYLEQMKSSGMQIDNNWIFISDSTEYTEESNPEMSAGLQIADQIATLDSGVTAVFCVNDMLAFGLIRGFKEHGICVPQDISIVGFDDIPLSQSMVPALTTIHCASYETGRLATIMLIDFIQNKITNNMSAFPPNMNLQPNLIERESAMDIR